MSTESVNFMRLLKSFCSINLLVGLLFYSSVVLLFPHSIEITGFQNEGSTLTIRAGEELLSSKAVVPHDGKASVSFWLPNETKVGSLNIVNTYRDFRLKQVQIKLWGMLTCECEVALRDIQPSGIAYQVEGFRVMPTRLQCWGTIAYVGLVLLFSFVAAQVGREGDRKQSCWLAFISACPIALLVGVVIPGQTFLANRSMFAFEGLSFLSVCIINILWVFSLIFPILYLSIRSLGSWIGALFLALALCGYLETGVLSIGLPSLTGNLVAFENAKRSFVDCGVLLGVFAGVCVLWTWQRGARPWMAAVLCFLMLVSMFDVRVEQYADTSSLIVKRFTQRGKIAQHVKYSHEKNVLIFILDSMTTEEVTSVFSDCRFSGLKDAFDGFTMFQNHIGMSDYTNPALAGMLTGEYFSNPLRAAEFYDSIYASNSVLRAFLDGNFQIYMMPGSRKNGYTNDEAVRDQSVSGSDIASMSSRVKDQQNWSMTEIVALRLVPYALKKRVYQILSLNWLSGPSVLSESVMFEMLAHEDFLEEAQRSFVLSHTDGTHLPISLDSDGNSLSHPAFDFKSACGQGAYVLKNCAKLMQAYRDMGIYDASFIVLTADHGGHYGELPPTNPMEIPIRARPFLMVKPCGARGALRFSNAPTSHSMIRSLLEEEVKRNQTSFEVESALTKKHRQFRIDFNGCPIDWWIDEAGGVRKEEGEYFLSTKDLKPVRLGYAYSLSPLSGTDRMEIIFKDSAISESGYMFWPANDATTFTFRVADAKCEYRLKLNLERWQSFLEPPIVSGSGQISFSSGAKCRSSFRIPADNKLVVELNGLTSDRNGLITVVCSRIDVPQTIIFTSMELDFAR